ncbi:MAG TPA: hypothetical protein ENK80_02000 [Rhodobacterales bacterium]|nr:hypothetical protein [Rhodobacterales bacterium]
MQTITQIARRIWKIGVGLAVLALSACSYAQVDQSFPEEAKRLDAATFECCADPEKFYPAPFVRVALSIGNKVGPTLSQAAYGSYEDSEYPGLLTAKPDAAAAILRVLQPLDILLVSNHSYQIGRLMPGRFSHSVINLGTEAQLRAAGLWSHPALVPYHDEIRAGNTMIEAAWPEVHLVSPQKTFEVDQVFAMRPALTPAQKRAAITRAFAVMGKPFNFSLGIDPRGERFACTGLVVHAMPELDFTLRDVYGIRALIPDDLAAQAIRGERLMPLIYVTGREGPGYDKRSLYSLMVAIAAYWGVPE